MYVVAGVYAFRDMYVSDNPQQQTRMCVEYTLQTF